MPIVRIINSIKKQNIMSTLSKNVINCSSNRSFKPGKDNKTMSVTLYEKPKCDMVSHNKKNHFFIIRNCY